jgi:hypothetical protein
MAENPLRGLKPDCPLPPTFPPQLPGTEIKSDSLSTVTGTYVLLLRDGFKEATSRHCERREAIQTADGFVDCRVAAAGPSMGFRFAGLMAALLSLPAVDVTPVANPNDSNMHDAIIEVGNDPPVAHPIFPKIAKFLATERFADAARVVEHRDAVTQKSQDAFCDLRIEFAELFGSAFGKFNAPGHIHPEVRLRECALRFPLERVHELRMTDGHPPGHRYVRQWLRWHRKSLNARSAWIALQDGLQLGRAV